MFLLKPFSSIFRSIGGLLAPTDVEVFKSDPVAVNMLIEERRQTKFARNAIATCFMMLTIFVVWAAFAPVHEVITGQGEVLPDGLVTQIQHLEGGIIEDVLIAPGERVEVGDVLVTLDTTSSEAELAKALARFNSAKLSIARLQSLANDRRTTGLDADLPLRRLDDDLPLRRMVDSQEAASESAEGYRNAQLDVIAAEVSMKKAELSGILIEQVKTQEELTIVNRQLVDYEAALKTGAISRRERDGIAREKLALEREEIRLNSRAVAARVAIEQANARELELLARLRHESLVNVTQLETERAESEAVIRQLEDRIARQRITSPIAGTVHVVNFHKAGEVVSPADIILEIVPDDGQVFVQIEIPADKVGGVRIGMDAHVKVLTYDFARFGDVDAVVQRISPTSVMTEEGNAIFQVDLRLTSNYVGPESSKRRVNPGMTVIANVTAGTKTILHYLLRPLRVLSDRALTES